MPPRKGTIRIWTDGSVGRQRGPGGWGAVLTAGKWRAEISGHEEDTTSQRMELMAAVRALDRIKGAQKIVVHSDSKYLVDGMKSGKPQALYAREMLHTKPNADLWEQLVVHDQFHEIRWEKIKGHSGDRENEIADALAKEARDNPDGDGEPPNLVNIRDYVMAEGKGFHPLTYFVDHKVEAKNPRNGKWEPAKLLSIFASHGEARVLFESTQVSQGYGKDGRAGRFAPSDTIHIDNVRVPEEVAG